VAKVLLPDLNRTLFETAASRPEWLVAHCAAVLAVSTTCRGVEIKNLRWQDVDLFSRIATIRRSKTAAGHRTIPLNGDAMAALARLLERARALGSSEPEHYVFSHLRGADHRSLPPPEELAHGVAETGSRNRQARR
jgi:integrase